MKENSRGVALWRHKREQVEGEDSDEELEHVEEDLRPRNPNLQTHVEALAKIDELPDVCDGLAWHLGRLAQGGEHDNSYNRGKDDYAENDQGPRHLGTLVARAEELVVASIAARKRAVNRKGVFNALRARKVLEPNFAVYTTQAAKVASV